MRSPSLLIASLFVLLAACKKDNCPTVTTEPNILLIIADDLGLDATPGYSEGTVKPSMPHLQQLAANGLTFDQVWANPICSPTRATILSGKYGYRTGVLNAESASTIPADEKTLQTMLDERTGNAYAHAIIGKWHLSNGEPNRPTEMGVGYYAGLLTGAVSDYSDWSFTENGQTSQYTGYITTKITDLAIDWIGTQTKPWFCWLAYNAPHAPFHLPPANMYSQGTLSSDQASIDANPLPYYMAMTESIDFELGRLMDSMSEEEIANTVIIFIGDNGSPSQVVQTPYSSNRAKGTLYQGGVHVPLIISGWGVSRKNEHDASLINSTDLFCTIAELAGATLPNYEDSYSFEHLLSQTGPVTRVYNYAEVLSASNPNKTGFTIRNERYKLIEFDLSTRRFYDLNVDPYEGTNLLNMGLTSDEQAELDALLTKASEIRQ
ncbi:MAG: arylsulfatase B [Bacteroidia bacterium]|jgi:arylsulfatase B